MRYETSLVGLDQRAFRQSRRAAGGRQVQHTGGVCVFGGICCFVLGPDLKLIPDSLGALTGRSWRVLSA